MLPVRSCDLYHPHAGLAAEAVQTGHLKHAGAFQRNLARVANRLNTKRQRFAAIEHDLLAGPASPVVLCLSDYVKQTVRRRYALPDERLATLFNAVDLHRFDPNRIPGAGQDLRYRLGIGPANVVALMIAQDFERKGLREAIEAVARLGNPRLVLLVVGKPSPDKYAALARRVGVAEQVVFAGPTPDPYPFYAAADFFVLPTRHDPCSLVVLESLAMGVPVVSTVFNGACEIMRTGEHGFVLDDPGDIPRLADAMGQLACDSYFQAQCAAACLRLRPALAYDAHVDRLLRLYQDVVR
jgi:UDP-glucose:(heptosyl)LPS alpha-1,3-glucosyltransferase